MITKREIFILLAVITLATAMVPRPRRAVNLDEDEESDFENSTTSEKSKKICMPQTPCAWSIYKSGMKIVDTVIINTYCICDTGTTCLINEDDSNGSAAVHRCLPPADHEENVES